MGQLTRECQVSDTATHRHHGCNQKEDEVSQVGD